MTETTYEDCLDEIAARIKAKGLEIDRCMALEDFTQVTELREEIVALNQERVDVEAAQRGARQLWEQRERAAAKRMLNEGFMNAHARLNDVERLGALIGEAWSQLGQLLEKYREAEQQVTSVAMYHSLSPRDFEYLQIKREILPRSHVEEIFADHRGPVFVRDCANIPAGVAHMQKWLTRTQTRMTPSTEKSKDA